MWQSILISLIEKAFEFFARTLYKSYEKYVEQEEAKERAKQNAEKYAKAKTRKEQVGAALDLLNGDSGVQNPKP